MVLHTHLPYVRRNGVWPVGEDFFHQAAVDSYLPLLATLRRLADAGVRDAVTVGLSPMIVHQMRDPYMRRELEIYLGRYELRTIQQVANYKGEFAHEIRDLASFYALHGRRQAELLGELPEGIASGFGELERTGVIEILGGPASHPHLPLIDEPLLLEAQIELGIAEHERAFGVRPRGVWLPECAYRPDTTPPLEDVLAREGVTHFVVDGPTMIRSDGRGAPFRPRLVGDASVAAFARHLDVTYRVWSPTGGYPGNKWYREFHRSDPEGGFKNWRVTNKQSRNKRPYEPARAAERAQVDAADFVSTIESTLDSHERESGEEGIVVTCFDTELYGHWWFEGPAFLDHVYKELAHHPRIRPVTLSGALDLMPPARRVRLEEGTWGFRKDNRSWMAPETEDMRSALSGAEADAVRLAAKLARATEGRAAALDQLVRETFLLQASDWPFMVVRGSNAGYARERFDGHLERSRRLARLLLDEAPDDVCAREAAALFEIDNPFPQLSASTLIGARAGGS
jgi:1,4-alpha-glucan branching enzyme